MPLFIVRIPDTLETREIPINEMERYIREAVRNYGKQKSYHTDEYILAYSKPTVRSVPNDLVSRIQEAVKRNG